MDIARARALSPPLYMYIYNTYTHTPGVYHMVPSAVAGS